MNTRQLETFLSASETLNLTETSRRLNFAQSSITAHIKKLEEELGYDLFERVGRQVVLTSQGELFKQKAAKLLTLMKESKTIGKEIHLMKIGAQESQCIYRLPTLLSSYKKIQPQVKMLFRPAHSNYEVEKEMMNGNLDIGFITDFKLGTNRLMSHKLTSEKILLLASPDSQWSQKRQVALSDLANESFLFTEAGCSYRTMFEQMLQKEGVFPTYVTEFISIEAIKQCAKLNIGLAVLPELTVREELEKGELVQVDLAEQLPMAHTYLVYHKDKQLLKHVKSFIDLVVNHRVVI